MTSRKNNQVVSWSEKTEIELEFEKIADNKNSYYLSDHKYLKSFQIQKVYVKQMFVTKISQDEYHGPAVQPVSTPDFSNPRSRDEDRGCTGKSTVMILFGGFGGGRLF